MFKTFNADTIVSFSLWKCSYEGKKNECLPDLIYSETTTLKHYLIEKVIWNGKFAFALTSTSEQMKRDRKKLKQNYHLTILQVFAISNLFRLGFSKTAFDVSDWIMCAMWKNIL